MTAPEKISPQSPMSAVLGQFPGAQRALFRRYHIGGCSSCGFQPAETLAEVCARNGSLNVDDVLAHIQSSHELDERILISAQELEALRRDEPTLKLVDVRSREEFEAVSIAGSVLLSQEVMREREVRRKGRSGCPTKPAVAATSAPVPICLAYHGSQEPTG